MRVLCLQIFCRLNLWPQTLTPAPLSEFSLNLASQVLDEVRLRCPVRQPGDCMDVRVCQEGVFDRDVGAAEKRCRQWL